MREVEAQPVGRDEAAALGDVVAERAAQRLVQQVRRRVVGADRRAPVVVDGELGRGAADELALLDPAGMDDRRPAFLRTSVIATRARSVRSVPVSPTWPPDSA